jgi:anti-sigma28 factor (negative regulator of flagellin synthesis)
MSDSQNNDQPKPRKRGITSVALGWLAERLRRVQQIKEELANGAYQVDNERVAAAIVSPSAKSEEKGP